MLPGAMRLRDLPAELNEISGDIWAAALEVHSTLGVGLLESAYRDCLVHELRLRGRDVRMEVPVPLAYKDLRVETAYRADIVVDGKVIIELKCVEAILPEHEAQLMTYLRLSGLMLGVLYNMHAPRLREGFRRRALRVSESPRTAA